jgi:filamentous hemagglutinin family protein
MMIKTCYKFLVYVSGICFSLISIENTVLAQILPDSTLGSDASTITQGSIENLPSTIVGGGVTRGKNLFHSFLKFNIENGNGAYFVNPNGVENIVARITWKDPSNLSNIDGTLGVLGNANLFLINPNGIIFGKNARLDVNGSFFASTADSIIFNNNYEFSASDPSIPPLLTINTPIGLRFGSRPGSIINRSTVTNSSGKTIGLQIQPGKTIGLIGGDVLFENGFLNSPGSEVNIGSVGSNSIVTLSLSSTGWQLGYEYANSFQDIRLLGSTISTSGLSTGNVKLQGRKIEVKNGEGILVLNSGNDPGGNISVYASESLTIDNTELPPGKVGGLITSALSSSNGNAGNIYIKTKQLTLKSKPGKLRASIRTSTKGKGKGGNLVIDASEFIKILGGELNTETNSSGDAGDLALSTSRLILRDGEISTSTGMIERDATGDSGKLIISASLVDVDHAGIAAVSFSRGEAGSVLIDTSKLTVRNGGIVTVSSRAGGLAGELEVNARSIFLNNGSLNANTTGGGGDIVLNANDIILRQKSRISTNATGIANGGNIHINAGVLAAFENSDITANSQESFGGRVSITAQGIFGTQFREKRTLKSDITATSSLGSEFSGTVELNTPDVDPSEGLVELPTTVVDPNTLVDQNACRRGAESEFTTSGRGGLPAHPNQDLSNTSAQVGLVEPATTQTSTQTQKRSPTASTTPQKPIQQPIAPAQGWVYNEKGEIVLVAYNPSVTSPQRLKDNTACAGQ